MKEKIKKICEKYLLKICLIIWLIYGGIRLLNAKAGRTALEVIVWIIVAFMAGYDYGKTKIDTELDLECSKKDDQIEELKEEIKYSEAAIKEIEEECDEKDNQIEKLEKEVK